jgi:hypothetical protein
LTGHLTDHGFEVRSALLPATHSSPSSMTCPSYISTTVSPTELWELSNSLPSASQSSKPIISTPAQEEDGAVLAALNHIQSLSDSQKRSLISHLKEQTPALEPHPTIIPGANWVSNHI